MSAVTAQPGKRRWLCVAYAFPPMNRSGTHRTAAFVKGLYALGWQATVLTTQPPPEEALDSALLLRIPPGTDIVRAKWCRPLHAITGPLGTIRRSLVGTGCVRRPGTQEQEKKKNPTTVRSIAELFSTPDSRTGWIVSAVWKGLGAIRRRRPELIYSTSPYASAHLIAMALNGLTGIPWVTDFRDPWCGNPFNNPRTPFVKRFDSLLESCVLQHATRVVCNTPTLAEHFVARYPELERKVHTILNGIDAESFAGIVPRRSASPEHFVFAHCGQFYGPRDPAVLFNAFRRFLTNCPDESQNARLALIGPDTFQGRPLSQIACEAGIADRVILCGKKTHAEALSLAAGANALVLVGAGVGGGNLQVPQKLFEYLALRRPIVALLPSDNPGAAILKEAQAQFVLCDPGDTDAIALGLREGIALAWDGASAAFSGVHRFDRSLRIAEMHSLFESMTRDRSPSLRSNQNKESCHKIASALDELGVPSMMPA